MVSRKHTAWKKSRKFGDVYGGRVRPRLVDNIFNRQHSLHAPGPQDDLPIRMTDNPSRDFFFPVTADEAVECLRRLPRKHHEGITHLWLRRVRKKDYDEDHPFANYICGSSVQLIVLYPWPTDMLLRFPGPRKPTPKMLRTYKQWCTDLVKRDGQWCLKWTREALRSFYLEDLLLHEVGHHIDYYRRWWTDANSKQQEDFAENYAVIWSRRLKSVYEE